MSGTEIARREPVEVLPARPVRDTVDGWVETIEPVARLAEAVCNTDFVPKALRGKAPAVMAAMLYGRELGFGPIRSLQSVHVVDGRPGVSAETARAMAFAQGHAIHIEETTSERCVVRGRRAGSEEWTRVTWTMDDARRAGLAGKENWRKHPRRMLQARATAELCHLIFADAIGGMPFTVEELEDDSDLVGGDGVAEQPRTAQRAARRSSRRKAEAAPAPADAAPESAAESGPPLPGEPGFDGDDGGGAPAAGDGAAGATGSGDGSGEGSGEGEPGITRDQQRKLQATFRDLGLGDRAERLRVASEVLGRSVATSSDLTRVEASTLIDFLTKCASQEDPAAALEALLRAAAEARGAGDGEAPSGDGAGDGAPADEGEQGALPIDGAPARSSDPDRGEA